MGCSRIQPRPDLSCILALKGDALPDRFKPVSEHCPVIARRDLGAAGLCTRKKRLRIIEGPGERVRLFVRGVRQQQMPAVFQFKPFGADGR